MHIKIATLSKMNKTFVDGYIYSPKKHKWFTDILWKLLHRFGAITPNWINETAYVYTFSDEDQDKIIKHLFNAIKIPYEFYDDPKNYKFVMGNEQFTELTHQRAVEFPLSVTMGPVRIGQTQGEKIRIFDVDIEVLPWIDGIALVKK